MTTQTNTLPVWAETLSEETQNQILAFQGKASSALARARAVESKAANEARDLTDEELNFVDAQLDAFTKYTGEVDGFQSRGRKVGPQAIAHHGTAPAALAAPAVQTGGKPFAQLFRNQAADTRFRDLGDFARSVATGDPRLFQNASGMTGTVGGEGGWYVPQTFLAGLIDGSMQDEAVRPRALVLPMTSQSMTMPMFKTADRSTGFAGMEPEVRAEGQTGTDQKGQTRLVTANAKKLMILVPTSTELLEDGGPIFTQLLQTYMQQALSQRLDEAFILGNEPAGPLGIVTAPCTVSVAKESGQVAATVVPQNLAKMIARLAPGSFKSAVWLAHPSVLAQLFVLTVKIQNAAANDFVGGFGPNWFTVAPDGQMSLLGRPLVVSDRCAPVGTVGDLILADLTQYAIFMRADARLAVDTSIGFRSDETWFRLTMRLDGMPLLDLPITPRNGTDTLSPFVTVATRA